MRLRSILLAGGLLFGSVSAFAGLDEAWANCIAAMAAKGVYLDKNTGCVIGKPFIPQTPEQEAERRHKEWAARSAEHNEIAQNEIEHAELRKKRWDLLNDATDIINTRPDLRDEHIQKLYEDCLEICHGQDNKDKDRCERRNKNGGGDKCFEHAREDLKECRNSCERVSHLRDTLKEVLTGKADAEQRAIEKRDAQIQAEYIEYMRTGKKPGHGGAGADANRRGGGKDHGPNGKHSPNGHQGDITIEHRPR